MRLVDHHGLTVKAMAVELLAGFVGIVGGHLHEGETIADNGNRQDLSDDLEKFFDGGCFGAVREITNQKFLCRSGCCHLNTYADM
jgi:hypothetical protein